MSSEISRPLGDYITLIRGTTYKGSLVGIPGPALLGLGAIAPGGGFRDGDFKTYGGECPEKLMLRPGDLFAALKGATKDGKMIGSVAKVPDFVPLGRLTQDTVKLVFTDMNAAARNYIYWALHTPQYREYCAGRAMGSAVVALSRDDFLSYPIPPLTPSRAHIVNLLQDIEDRYRLLSEANATLEAIAQAFFKSWFVEFDPVRAKQDGRVPEGMDEATAALFPDSFEESTVCLVPKGWRIGTLADVSTISSGKRPPDREDKPSKKCEVPLYGGAGLMGYTSDSLFDTPRIVTGRVGTLGKVHIAYPPFWASDNVLIINPKQSVAFAYCFHWVSAIDVHALNRGSTQPLLTQKDLGAQSAVIPPLAILAEFEAIVLPIYNQIRGNLERSQTISVLRDTLLPCLISGQLRVPETAELMEHAA